EDAAGRRALQPARLPTRTMIFCHNPMGRRVIQSSTLQPFFFGHWREGWMYSMGCMHSKDARRASLPARLPIEAIMLSEDAAGRRAARLPIEAMILSDDVAGRRALPLPLPILHTQNTDSAVPPYYTSTARRCRRRRCGGRLP